MVATVREGSPAASVGGRDGRDRRWDRHRRERRLTIVAAAIVAIEEDGPDALTGRIASRAGVPRTHVYRHFEDKQALDLAVSRHVAAELGARIRRGLAAGSCALDVIGGAISEHLAWMDEHPNLYRFLARHSYAVRASGSPGVDDAKAAFAGELTTVLAGYLRHFGLDRAPAERVVVGVVGMVDATAAWWLERRDVPREELTATLTGQVWRIIDDLLRDLGLQLDPRQPLPAPSPPA